MRALITGAGGFVGSHLSELLLKQGLDVYGLLYPGEPQNDLPVGAHTVVGDLVQAAALRELIKKIRPEQVYHLAAISSVPASLQNPSRTFQVNVFGTINLLETLRETSPAASVLNVSTAHVYSISHDGETLTEGTPVRANTPYDASKLMCEHLAEVYSHSYGMRIVTVRSFNHIGPRQSAEFACSDFARQIAAIRKGAAPPIMMTGNLAAARDFTDVRDVVRAYSMLVEKGRAGETYNVCSGEERSMEWIFDELCRIAGVQVERRVDPARLRTVEHLRLRGDNRKIYDETHWKPEILMTKTLSDLLDYWMQVPERESAGA
jgi:GDP-4-dehydro-6-deoxy-D-mannose reductase